MSSRVEISKYHRQQFISYDHVANASVCEVDTSKRVHITNVNDKEYTTDMIALSRETVKGRENEIL